MTASLKSPNYGAVIANPPNTVAAERDDAPAARYRPPVRDTMLRARGIRPQASRPQAPGLQVPRQAPGHVNARQEMFLPDYTEHPTAGIDRATLAMGPGLGQPERVPLKAYNAVIAQVVGELNATMAPLQRRLARSIAITGSLLSAGGAVAAGVLGATALGSVASGVGMPVGAAAAIAGVAVFIIGSALTLLAGVAVRAVMRAPIDKHPALSLKLETVRELRDDLLDIKRRSPAEQDLLRNVNRVLGKVEGVSAHFKAQVRVMGKTQAVALGGVFLAGFSALAAASTPNAPLGGGHRAMARWLARRGKPMQDRTGGEVSSPHAHERLQLLSRVLAP